MTSMLNYLANAFLDGRAADDEADRLNALLRDSAAARDEYLRLADMHACMAVDERLWCGAVDCEPTSRPANAFPAPHGGWRRPFVAAVLGLLAGLGCAGLVFAYVVPLASRAIGLLHSSFESGAPPLTTGMPSLAEVWSGDYSEVVGVDQGVIPHDGRRMLRMLRADHEGKAPRLGYVADMYRIIDLRPYRDLLVGGNAVLHVAGAVNAVKFQKHERYSSSVHVYALHAPWSVGDRSPEGGDLVELSLASARRALRDVDRDTETWQPVTGELRLPAETSFVLVALSISHATPEQQASRHTFDGHYFDDVRVWLELEPPRSRSDTL